MEKLFLFLIEVILYPAAGSKKISLPVRILCLILILAVTIIPSLLCLYVGISMMLEHQTAAGLGLIAIGVFAIWYFLYEYKEVSKKSNKG